MGGKGGGDGFSSAAPVPGGGKAGAPDGWVYDPDAERQGFKGVMVSPEDWAASHPAPAAAAAPGPSLGGATDTADPAAPTQDSSTTDSSTGGTLASSVLKAPSYWNNQVNPQTAKKSTGSAVVTQT